MSAEHISRVRRLYKLILRLHRNLPDDLRLLGDNYTREEFKRHKKCKPQEALTFLKEWGEYALSMSRQVAPQRAVRPEPADERQQPRAGPSREVRQQAPRPAVPFGLDFPPGRLLQMTPEQIFSFYLLRINARGDNPHEPLDGGIGLLDTDIFAKQVQEAKKHVFEIIEEEKQKLARGDLRFEDLTFQTTWWLELLDEAVKVKDKREAAIAKSEADNEEEAKKAEEAAKKAKEEAEKAKEEAEKAKEEAEKAKVEAGKAKEEADKAMEFAETAKKIADKAKNHE